MMEYNGTGSVLPRRGKMAPGFENMSRILVCLLILFPCVYVAKKGSRETSVPQVSDMKELKKFLRTRTNVMVVYAKNERAIPQTQWDLLATVAEDVRGLASIFFVDCGVDKKLCKKMKVDPATVEMKHYKDGSFNKDYDRKNTAKSMISFLRDPTGDIPWGEDNTAEDVVHVESEKEFNKVLKKEKLPILAMFYAPWCGFCKKLKPDYAAAATELKGEAVLLGFDVDKPPHELFRQKLNVTSFPTMLYYRNGQLLYKYGGENNKQGIIDWLKSPGPPKEPEKEAEWADEESEVAHLTEETFDDFMDSHSSVLVMFYAPWCGHCKKMKPEYTEAAATLQEEGVEGVLAAVDVTKAKPLGDRYEVKGFPTVKYFRDGKVTFDFNERTADKMVEFMKDPKEPPPPPPPEPAWEDTESEVIHLNEDNVKSTLKRKKHCLVMFYAPWCGHCKKAKPEFTAAAEQYREDNKVGFAALDCTRNQGVCQTYDVTGYPTFIYYQYGKNAEKYTGGREEADFVNFMKDPQNPPSSLPPAPTATPEETWSDAPGHENLYHLTAQTFDSFMAKHNSVLIMFYAPWCGHCKAMKPAYAEAATTLKTSNMEGVLAAVDATAEPSLGSKFGIKGYPTLKYFKNGEYSFDYDKPRNTESLIAFMKKPEKPVPDVAWADEPSSVVHITGTDSFAQFIAQKDSVLAMFYAPWCGHCKKAKPEYTEAAEALAGESSRSLVAVDCTSNKELCQQQEVSGYPTFRFYHQGQFVEKYMGGRTTGAFVEYIKNPPLPSSDDTQGDQAAVKEEL